MDVIAVTEEMRESAGIIVWWELGGMVPHHRLVEAAEFEGLAADKLPKLPSLLMALSRAAQGALMHKRQLLRPLKTRGAWEIVEETVVSDDEGRERTQHRRLVSGAVRKPEGGDAYAEIRSHTQEAEELGQRIRGLLPIYQESHNTTDISNWLIWFVEGALTAVSLRARGGFYFIPNEQVAAWRVVARTIKECSEHSLYEIPAMRTQEAVDAILSAVSRESQAAFDELERYLEDGVVSTRGLNAYTRKMDECHAKVQRYSELLGVRLPELLDRAEQLKGALTAAHLQGTE